MADLFENPMGLMGFEFIEFASPTPNVIEPVLESLGFSHVANHRSKDVVLFRQGDINAIVNREKTGHAAYFAAEHGPSVCGMAFRCRDSHHAYAKALELGAQAVDMPTAVPHRSLRGGQLHLRHRFRVPGRRRAQAGGGRAQGHRPSDPQRLSRAHGLLGRLLRAAVQLPRVALLRHQGRVHRPDLQGHDRTGRPGAYPAQRGVLQGGWADRGIPHAVQRRGHPARGLSHR